jgi:hypothetical protein
MEALSLPALTVHACVRGAPPAPSPAQIILGHADVGVPLVLGTVLF